jgi:hypothetical protein
MEPLRSLFLAGLALLAAPAGDGNPALDRALASVSSTNIAADIAFIASDELAGRDTPSEGLKLAARYIRARLERLGFEPAGDAGFFDLYDLERGGVDVEASSAWVQSGTERTELTLGEDYGYWGGGAGHDLEAPVTYVGAATAEELEGQRLDGRWALVVTGSGSDWGEYRARMERLQEAGALGVLSAPDPEASDAKQRDGFLRRMARGAGRGSLRLAGGEERGGSGLVSVSLSSSLASRMLANMGSRTPGQPVGMQFGERRVERPRETFELENVAGLWRGSDPVLAKEVIIFSAHYDHVGVQNGEIYNGADDNGSGTCGMLAVAEALAAHGPMRRSVLLLWVSGEEKGLLGSAAWTKAPTLPEGLHAICDLNIDMIGRNAPDALLITPSSEHPNYNGLTRRLQALAPLEGFPTLGTADEYWRRSDQMNFADNLGLPVAFLFSGEHEDYHQPGDDPEKIDSDKIRRVVRLLVRLLGELQEDELGLEAAPAGAR